MEYSKSQHIEQWKQYCQEIGNHDEHDFFNLFMDEPTPDQVNEILSPFKGKEDELYINFSRIIFGKGYPEISVSRIETLIMAHAQEIFRILNVVNQGHLLQNKLNNPIRQMEDTNALLEISKKNELHSEIGSWVGDFVIDAPSDFEGAVFGLSEAAYGLTNDTMASDFLIQPLKKEAYDFSNYFELWLSGVDFVFTEDELLYSIRG